MPMGRKPYYPMYWSAADAAAVVDVVEVVTEIVEAHPRLLDPFVNFPIQPAVMASELVQSAEVEPKK